MLLEILLTRHLQVSERVCTYEHLKPPQTLNPPVSLRSCPAENYLRVPPRELQPAGHNELHGHLPESVAHLPRHKQLSGLSNESTGIRLQMVSGIESVQHRYFPVAARLGVERLRCT